MSSFIHAVMMNDTSLCDDLLDYYNKSDEYKQEGYSIGADKKSKDVVVYPNSKNETIQKYINFLMGALKNYQEMYDSFTSHVGFAEAFNIQHYEPNEGFLNWHCERSMSQSHQRALVFMTYLNDVPDGGGTEFAYYPDFKINAKKGYSLIWPTDFTHTHRGVISQHEKYIATGWFNH